MKKRISYIAVLVCSLSQTVLAENWQPLTGASILQDLVSGSTAKIELKPGVKRH